VILLTVNDLKILRLEEIFATLPAALLLQSAPAPPASWAITETTTLLQMIHEGCGALTLAFEAIAPAQRLVGRDFNGVLHPDGTGELRTWSS
jgi:hypothetical protein